MNDSNTEDLLPPSYSHNEGPPHDSPAADATSPPPLYKAKRTPSQEETYMQELKAWAAEKEKMYPGAYGEYFGKVPDPARVPRWRYDEWYRLGSGETVKPSREARDLASDREVHAVVGGPLYTVEPVDRRRRTQSLGESSTSAAHEMPSPPREGFIKRRLSSMKKIMGLQEAETQSQKGTQEE